MALPQAPGLLSLEAVTSEVPAFLRDLRRQLLLVGGPSALTELDAHLQTEGLTPAVSTAPQEATAPVAMADAAPLSNQD